MTTSEIADAGGGTAKEAVRTDGSDRTMRDAFRQSPHHGRTAASVERYDHHAFDSSRATPPLSAFEPLARQTFSQPRRTLCTALLVES